MGSGDSGGEATSVRLGWRLVLALLAAAPQGAMSRLAGRLADLRLPRPVRRPVLGFIARRLGIEVGEAELALEDYPSFDRFFVRSLKPGSRPLPPDRQLAVSPVDGILGELGNLVEGRLLQAKGRWYTAADLLDDPTTAAGFVGGSFVTVYLTPRHYHRIHSPCDGAIPLARHVPGGLLPVNPPAVATVDRLFVRNERLICHLDGAMGRVAVVAVGALNVGRISAAFDPAWNCSAGKTVGVTNRRGTVAESRTYDPAPAVARGDEIMAFHLGSTVVVLFEPGRVELFAELEAGTEVRMGQGLARIR